MDGVSKALKIGLYVPQLDMAVHFAAVVLTPSSAYLGQAKCVSALLDLPEKIGHSCDNLIERLAQVVQGAESVEDAERRILSLLRPEVTSFVVTAVATVVEPGENDVDLILDEAEVELETAGERLDLISAIDTESKLVTVPIGTR